MIAILIYLLGIAIIPMILLTLMYRIRRAYRDVYRHKDIRQKVRIRNRDDKH